MHSRTLVLKDAIDAIEGSAETRHTSERRHDLLKNSYAGETAYIVSCGPSLKAVWSDEIRDFLANKLVISVKQAYDFLPFSDFHLYNEVRMKSYVYEEPTIKLSVSQFLSGHPSHIHYPIYAYKYDEALFCTNDYERWDLDKSFVRPWGVGIMFELGLHLPLFLGCKNVVIIGFDMNDKGTYHFYDDHDDQDSEFYKVDREEFAYARASSKVYHDWCSVQGVKVHLYSPLSKLKIPQMSRVEFLDNTPG